MKRIAEYFLFRERQTDFRTEVLAGLTTFFAMAYIVLVNPAILAQGGMSPESVRTATVVAAGLSSLAIGLWANLPFSIAAGMSFNSFFALMLIKQMGVPVPTALGSAFVAGMIFLLLTILPWRDDLLKSLPASLRLATASGTGMFIAAIGLNQSGLIGSSSWPKPSLGGMPSATGVSTVAGMIIIMFVMSRPIRHGLFWGLAATSLLMMALDPSSVAGGLGDRFFCLPSPAAFWAGVPSVDIMGAFDLRNIPVVATFLFMMTFDVMGTLTGLSCRMGIYGKDHSFPGVGKSLTVAAAASVLGTFLGTSPQAVYIENAVGIQAGGRTGFAAVVTGGLFLSSLFLPWLPGLIPKAAACAAQIIVGMLMLELVREIETGVVTEGLPAFLTIIVIPLSGSIANGVMTGIVSHTMLKAIFDGPGSVAAGMYALTGLIAVSLAALSFV